MENDGPSLRGDIGTSSGWPRILEKACHNNSRAPYAISEVLDNHIMAGILSPSSG
jgi:hypothetical protein